MNLLIISYDFCLEAGGIQNTSYLLAYELSKYVNVFTFCSSNGNSPQIVSVKSFRCKYSCNRTEKELYEEESIKEIEKIHEIYHLDYILVLHYNYALAAYRLKKKYGVPFGIMVHGNEALPYSLKYVVKHPRSRIKALYERKKIFNYATDLFCNTFFTKSLVQKISSKKSIYVINPPISMMPQKDQIVSSNNGTLLSVGRLVERKGFQNVIMALPKLLSINPSIKYIIAGCGEYEKQLRELVKKLRLEEVVVFKGRISEEEKYNLLSECSIFLMPSFIIKKEFEVEGFGISLIEANSYGKFVIASKSGGIPEAVNENVTGFLVTENDVDSIVNAVLKFYKDGFSYNPEDCINWAKKRHISLIAKEYLEIISNEIR